MRALSIRRPWTWAILHLPPEVWKDIENRTWSTPFRGKVLLHAGKTCTRDEYEEARAFILRVVERFHPTPEHVLFPPLDPIPTGIVGWVEITDCVSRSDSPWFCGPYGFVLGRRGELDPIPCRGQLGFFDVPHQVAAQVRAQAKARNP